MAAIASVLNLMAVLTVMMMSTSCAYDFYVGGRDGWVQKPSGNFNQWAERSRFQVNDKLVFRYRKGEDSVLVVSEADYRACNTSNPIQRLDGGDSVFQFDRSGPFFFISGDPGRCQSGQKLIVVVLAARGPKSTSSPPPVATPAPLPSPPSATPLPSPTAAPVTSPTTSPSAAPTPSATAAPTPSPSAAPTPSATAAPSPSPSAAPSPAPSPAALSPAPSPSETLSAPSPAPTAQVLPPSFAPTEGPSSEVPSAAVPSPSSEVASTPGPSPSASSYAGASLWTVAVALALGFAAFLPW